GPDRSLKPVLSCKRVTVFALQPPKHLHPPAFLVTTPKTLSKAGSGMDNRKLTSLFEITGSVSAMVYAVLIASNTGNEILGFSLLLLSASLFAAWAVIDRRWTFLLLQAFYGGSAILGLIRWG
ncbi:MAG: hypothetical protein WBV62_14335, partial [Roseobacter sp.]